MDTINPWLDPSEVRHLAEKLLRPVAPAKINAADPGFNDTFVGFTPQNKENVNTQEDQNTSTQRLPAIPTSNQEPAPEHQPEAEFQPVHPAPAPEIQANTPPQDPSQARFLERIHIFRDWLAQHFKASEIFILDADGNVIFDESGHGRLHSMACNLAATSDSLGNIHVKIGPSSILEVLPCNTAHGRIILGTLVPDTLPPHHVQAINEVLTQAASPA